MVMEYLEGSDLEALLKTHGPMSIEYAVMYILQACHAIAEAHSLDITHRDVKPSNLFLTRRTDGTPCIKVLDFGISKVASEIGGTLGQWISMFNLSNIPVHVNDLIFGEVSGITQGAPAREFPSWILVGWYCLWVLVPGGILWARYRRLTP